MRKAHGSIDANIGRHPKHRQRMAVDKKRGRTARTDYRVVQSRGGISWVECVLHSGRTHQIRVHLHHLGHPVLGDKVYGKQRTPEFPRQMLHAWKLGFNHPRDGKRVIFEAPVPADFLL
jgi:23S rRNA pseudouridine1911/1915/1917 synthase